MDVMSRTELHTTCRLFIQAGIARTENMVLAPPTSFRITMLIIPVVVLLTMLNLYLIFG